MVSDYVTPFRNLCGNIRTLANITADQKKRGRNLMPGENIEQIAGVRLVWAVVEGQRDLLRTSLATAECSPEALAGWS
jgi:hypothetical protein